MSWRRPRTVSGETPAPVALSATIGTLDGGKYSYILRIPHQAKSSGLTVPASVLPLYTGDASFEAGSITVDGQPARPLNGFNAGFLASQPRRGGAHRLDLEVFSPLEDSDGDGIPDLISRHSDSG
jgi:hypothetical protein